MSRPEQSVHVFAIVEPTKVVPREKRRYRIKWRVDGHDKTRSRKTKAEAERLYVRLKTAAINGEEFDPVSGYPVSWLKKDDTWWTWSQEYLGLKWLKWSGNSRRSAVESLVAITPLMAKPGAPPAPKDLAQWLRTQGYCPGSSEWENPPDWLMKSSILLAEIGPGLLEDVLTAVTTKRDGTPASKEVARRRRTTLNAILRSAIRRKKLESNPLDEAEWTLPARNLALDISTVPYYADVLEMVDFVAALRTEGARYSAFFGCIGIAGMRPSEAGGLDVPDLDLPKKGWGLAVLRGATTSPGTRYTTSGDVVEDKELKQRPEDAVREVPLEHELVKRLRWHLDRFPPVDGRVFTNAAGRPLTTTNYGPVWIRARNKLWPKGHRFSRLTVYMLRHAAATRMLRAGLTPAEVARRLGNSVELLMRVYAGVFDDERERSNGLLDQAHAEQAQLRQGHRAA